MNESLHTSRTLRAKLYTARRVFLKPPSLIQRLRLYAEFRRFSREWDRTEDFELKIRDVCAGADNPKIPRVPEAGAIRDGHLIMHNGLRIVPDSYTGPGMTRLLEKNRGVHEPQEEYAFGEVLAWLAARGAAAPTMIELGSYWAFYSLWFQAVLPGGRSFCVEPDPENLDFGQQNFRANGRLGDFTQAYVGAEPANGTPPTISVDSFLREKAIDHVDILHADIQGYELEMVRGARETLARGAVDYIFISTHHNFLHYRCIDELKNAGYAILAEADLLETCSTDGLIVAGREGMPRLDRIAITPRQV